MGRGTTAFAATHTDSAASSSHSGRRSSPPHNPTANEPTRAAAAAAHAGRGTTRPRRRRLYPIPRVVALQKLCTLKGMFQTNFSSLL